MCDNKWESTKAINEKNQNNSIQKILFEIRLMMMDAHDRFPNQRMIPIRHGFLVLSAFQLIALVFCAFVIGAIVPVFVQIQNTKKRSGRKVKKLKYSSL
jgi:hypothetical protein